MTAPRAAADSVLVNQAPTDVYAVLAQKALECWTGSTGPFFRTHLFHADAAPPTSGGQAEIGLHERDTTQQHPWGPRVFRISLTPQGGGVNTFVDMQNLKLPSDLADAMRLDVIAWTEGRPSCQAQIVRPPAPETVVKPAKGKGKKAKQA